MLSNATPLDETTAELADDLRTLLPDTWRVASAVDRAGKVHTPTVFYELTGWEKTIDGEPLPPGSVGANYTLTLTVPPVEAEPGLNVALPPAVLHLMAALDRITNLHWATAEPLRLETGQAAARLPITLITSYS